MVRLAPPRRVIAVAVSLLGGRARDEFVVGGQPSVAWHMASRPHHSPLRVLAIEDSADIRGFYGALLTEEGYAVKLASHGAEGLAVLGWEPDVILLDLLLPVMDGYEFLRRLRASPLGRDVPVLVLSGSLSPTRTSVRGAQAVLRKPFDFGYLMRSIQVLATGGIAPASN